MAKKRTGAAFQQPRALDKVRGRRQGGTAASGNVAGKGIVILAGGQISVPLGDGLEYDQRGRPSLRTPAPPLALLPGSPRRFALEIADGLEINARGRLAPKTSTSVRVRDGALVATPTTAEVMDAENEGETAVQALARKANTGDGRFPIARGIATLVAGTVTVALTTIEVGAIVLVNHEQFAGSPGLLSYSLIAGQDFTITSNDAGDTSTVAYAVWNP